MTTSAKLTNATGLYLEGIRDGNAAEAIEKYTGDRYTQHSTGVADGKEGFIAFFEPFLARNPVRDIQVARAIEDGQYAFCHVFQSLNDGAQKWVTADLFDTDERDRIIEHWDVIQEYAEDPDSGRSMVDGPTEVRDLDQTDANKAIVRGFVDDVLLGRRAEALPRYVSEQAYVRHPPHADRGLIDDAVEYVKVHRLIGQGNFVVVYSHTKVGGEDHAVFDLFRLESGTIVEHWDVQEKIAPKEMWNNGGKF